MKKTDKVINKKLHSAIRLLHRFGVSQKSLAVILGVSQPRISQIVNG